MTTDVPPTEHYVLLGEALKFLEPFVTALISGLLTMATSLVARRLYQVFGIKLTDAQWAVVHSAALAAAGKIWAAAEPTIATARIHTGSPGIAAAAQAAIDLIPEVVKATRITPDEMASLIVSKIGILQSASGSGVMDMARVGTIGAKVV